MVFIGHFSLILSVNCLWVLLLQSFISRHIHCVEMIIMCIILSFSFAVWFWLFSELSFWLSWRWFAFEAMWKSRNLGGSYFLWWFSWLWSNTDSSETWHSHNDFRSIHIFIKEFTKLFTWNVCVACLLWVALI